ncbi:hypothetical protein JB92DRAFT_674408, partial [Gautieria morchelliformis]
DPEIELVKARTITSTGRVVKPSAALRDPNFNIFLRSPDRISQGMTLMQWWGVNPTAFEHRIHMS